MMKDESIILPNYIGGKWVASEAEEFIPFYNPAFATEIGRVPNSTNQEIEKAVDAALDGFAALRKLPVTERVKILLKLRELIISAKDSLAKVLVENHGRTLQEGIGEVNRSLENIESAASIAYTLAKGETMPNVSTDLDQTLLREPLGVFAIITPFNIPMHAWSSYVPYAIALGCSVVVKPSEVTPMVSNELFKLMESAGVPKGGVNLIHGGPSVSEALITHRAVTGVGFIGSTKTGRRIYEICGREGKRASINAGAKNCIVLMPDARMEKTIPALTSSFFGMSGQRCLAGSNLIVVGKAMDRHLDIFVKSSSLKLGYGLDPETQMGPMSSRPLLKRVLNYITKGEEEHGKVLLDGRKNKPMRNLPGFFVGPTIFTDVGSDASIAKEEIFGPVVSILSCEKLEDAIRFINDKTDYGNAASIFTSNARVAREFAMSVEAGNVGINVGVPQPMAYFPIGGRKQSFFGAAHSRVDTIRLFTDHKVISTRWW